MLTVNGQYLALIEADEYEWQAESLERWQDLAFPIRNWQDIDRHSWSDGFEFNLDE